MAWLDDRIWCHPKLVDVTDKAYRAYINSLAYSSGFHLAGRLTPGQQRTVGADSRVRAQLVKAGLWDLNGDGQTVVIHDWQEHNEKRDERRAADRERKKALRERGK